MSEANRPDSRALREANEAGARGLGREAPCEASEVIVAHALTRRFGELVAVRGIDLRIARGEVFGVLGPNGAGKSTLIRMLCGILAPTSGTATVAGFDIARDPERVKRHLGYMTQRFSLYDDLAVAENLEFFAGIYGVPRRERRDRVDELVTRMGLAGRRDDLVGTLSGGWKQRVALVAATIHRPPVVFLDEPTAGVDPVARREFWSEVHGLATRGTTIVVTTHYMDEAERCHRLAFVFGGRVLDEGRPDEVVARRHLAAIEVDLAHGEALRARLRDDPGLESIEPYGGRLRIVMRDRDPAALAATWIARDQIAVSRPTVEDAFVAMMHEERR